MLVLGGRSRLRLAVIAIVFCLAVLVGGLSATSAWYDLRSDVGHPSSGHTYRVLITGEQAGRTISASSTPRSMAERLNGGAGVVAATAVILKSRDVRARPENNDQPLKIAYVDPAFPDVFNFGVSVQEVRNLEASGGLLLTRNAARTLGAPASGSVWIEGGAVPVAGQIDDPAPNGHLQFDAIAAATSLPKVTNVTTGDIVQVNDSDAATYVTVAGRGFARALATTETVRNDLTPGFNMKATLQPLRRIRLEPAPESDAAADLFVTGRGQDLYAAVALATIALMGALTCGGLLVRAVVEREARVIGILKAVGQTPRVINLRLFRELGSIALLALLVATLAAIMIGPDLFQRLDKDVDRVTILLVFSLAALPALFVVVAINCLMSAGLVSRSIPRLLAGGAQTPRRLGPETVVIGLQAGLLMTVVFVAIFVGSQLERAVETSKRFEEVWRVEIERPDDLPRLTGQFEASSAIRQVVATSWAPYSTWSFMSPVRLPEQSVQQSVQSALLWSDGDVTEILGLPLLAGARLAAGDAQTCRALANASLVTELGLDDPSAAVGRTVHTLTGDGHFSCVIAGVVADARYRTARLPLSPALHILADPTSPLFEARYILLTGDRGLTAKELSTRSGTATIQTLPQQLKALEHQAYRSERRLLTALALAAGLIFLAVSATFASAVALAIEERVVEIGIRRTLGFSWLQIGVAITRPIALSAAIGTVLAVPATTWIALAWSSTLLQPVAVQVTDLVICALIVILPLVIAVGLNWRRLSTISPAEVLRG